MTGKRSSSSAPGRPASQLLMSWRSRPLPSTIVEKDAVVGGISRTVQYKGYHFDIGGHRFFTKVDAVERLWQEVLKDDHSCVGPRLSRIYYNEQFFNYPLRAANALLGLGALEQPPDPPELRAVHSSLRTAGGDLRTVGDEPFRQTALQDLLQDVHREGLGHPVQRDSADWAAQRIKDLSLLTALRNVLLHTAASDKRTVIKTLIDASTTRAWARA